MLLARLTGLVLLCLAVLGLGVGGGEQPSSPLEPNPAPRVAWAGASVNTPVDTLHPTVTAGESLILPLPTELESVSVDRYSLLRGPALSGVAGRSFTWVTHSVEPNTYDVLLQAIRSDAPADTLLLRVEVQE